VILALAAVLVGAFVQSATGFGFALVAGPALLAVLEPREAVVVILLLGALLNLLLLFAERRQPDVRTGDVARMVAGAAPGILLGLLVLQHLAKPFLQALVGVVVIGAAVAQAGSRRTGRGRVPAPPAGGYPVGVVSGVLTTSTGVNGPPLVLWLRARGLTGGALRDSVTAALLCLSPLGLLALLALDALRVGVGPLAAPALAAAAAAGHYAGRQAFLRIGPAHYEGAVLLLVLATGAASVAAGLGAFG
jgi:uncharacterized membrane protein YfcA